MSENALLTSSPSQSVVHPALGSFFAGAAAGLIVDVGLFPIDTVKTRLQSVGGFRANGGFKDIYKGLGVVTMGSVPGGAIFFATYDSASRKLLARLDEVGKGNAVNKSENGMGLIERLPSVSALGARVLAGSIAECSACLVRVPVELFKQRLQVGHHGCAKGVWADIVREAAEMRTAKSTITKTSTSTNTTTKFATPSSICRVLYRGYPITVFREVPFAMIQMPLYETLKALLHFDTNKNSKDGMSNTSSSSSPFAFVGGIAPGFISGGVSAVLTTPLDVVKTRIMTMGRSQNKTTTSTTTRGVVNNEIGAVRMASVVMKAVVKEEGWRALFKGGMTRCVWISTGGALFFGTYEGVKGMLCVS